MDSRDAARISLAVYLDRHTTRYPIYIALVVIMLVVVAVLPFLKVEVSVGSPGILRPIASVTPIKMISSGVVKEIHIRENQRVRKGESLLYIHAVELSDRLHKVNDRLAEVSRLSGDVTELSSRVRERNSTMWFDWIPVTPMYQQLLAEFQQRYQEVIGQLAQARRDHQRSRVLFESGVIAASEMEQADEVLRKHEGTVSRLVQTQLTEWQELALKYDEETVDLNRSIEETKHAEDQNKIVAPVSGTIHQLVGLTQGSAVFAGQEIGYISPDTTLVAEVRVAPADVGLIREGLHVNFQVMAYNYNEWGMLEGAVSEVSNDVLMENHVPYYRVVCTISREHLSLSNGYKGLVRKGMTLHGRFIVGRRSVWQLLFDKADDWLNPAAN